MDRQLRSDIHAPGAALNRPDEVLFRSPVVQVGRWRCPVWNHHFRDSGPAGGYFFCFPRTSVWIRHEGGAPFVADPNTVTYYNDGQVYWRDAIAPEGDHGDWFGIDPHVIAQTLVAWDPAAADRPERPFAFTHGPSDPASYLLQRSVFEHVRREASPDVLFVEETVLDVLARISGLAYESRGVTRAAGTLRRSRDLAEAARGVVACHYRESLSLADIAARVESSVFHLARIFRKETGTTLHAYRTQLRLRGALERLSDPAADLLDVALDFGFSSHSHFTESFRRAYGAPPREIRQRLAGPRT